MSPPVYLVGRGADLERDIAAHLGAELRVESTDDPQYGWELVRRAVDAGRTPMVWADIKHLEYLHVRMHNTRHDVLVVGYDETAGIAWIADNDRDELQACSLESLARARNSDSFPGPNRHTTFVYEWPDRLPKPRAATRAALRCACDNMRAGDGGLGQAGGFGILGIDRFAGAYPRWPERFDQRLPEVMGALEVFIVKAGTGGAMFRTLHARFLEDMAELLEDSRLGRLARTYASLASLWEDLAVAASRTDHDAGLPLVQEIRQIERFGVAQTERWLGMEEP